MGVKYFSIDVQNLSHLKFCNFGAKIMFDKICKSKFVVFFVVVFLSMLTNFLSLQSSDVICQFSGVWHEREKWLRTITYTMAWR